MLKYFKTILAAIFIFNMPAAQAADEPQNFVVAEIAIFSQKLRFKLPTDWQHAHTSQNETTYLIEFIPKDEKIENWTNLFSVQGIKDFDPAIKPEDVANSVANGFAKSCPQSVVYTKLGPRFLNGYEAFLAIIGCSVMANDHKTNLKKGMSEISYYVFIKGKRDLYIAHKSIRGIGFTADKFPPFVEKSVADMKNFFPIEFCSLDSTQGQCVK